MYGTLDHSSAANRDAPSAMPEASASAANAFAAPTQVPARPPHPALQQASDALARSPNIAADAFVPNRDNVVAGMALHGLQERLRIDHIVLDSRQRNLIGVQGPLSDPTSRLTTPLPVAQATLTDVRMAEFQLERLQPTANTAPPVPLPLPARENVPHQSVPLQSAPPQNVPLQHAPQQDAPRPHLQAHEAHNTSR